MGNKIKKKKSDLDIGKLIVKAWTNAKDSMTDPFVINRKDLIDTLVNGGFVDTGANTGGNNKRIVIDVVFDTDLNDQTRLVWIAIPTPDTAKTKPAWEAYINSLSTSDIKKIGTSVLFGCGR